MVKPNAPRFIRSAVTRIHDELPDLVGADWATIQPQVDAHLTALQVQPDDYRESAGLVGLLARYEAARLRLDQELTVQEIVAANITPAMADMQYATDEAVMAALMAGLAWEVDPATVPSPEERDRTARGITLKDGGAAGGRSIKFRNLDLDLGQMLTVGAGFLLAGHDMLDKPTPFMVAGGILVMVGTLLNEMTVRIEQQEATVFWGFIVATNSHPQDRQASADAVFATTNTERTRRGLPALTDEQFRHSLYKLQQLGSIERLESDHFRMVEKFKVKR